MGSNAAAQAASRTLVVAPSWVGDAVLSQPLLAALAERRPESPIDVLAPAWCAPVYRRMPEAARVVAVPFGHGELALRRRWRLGRELGRAGYARAFVLPNSLKSALVPWFARIAERVGYVGEQRQLLLSDCRRLDARSMPRLVDRFAALAAEPGAPQPAPAQPRLAVDPEQRRALALRLGLAVKPAPTVLCPGAEFGPAKRWPAAHFATLARALLERGDPVWVVGSANDAAIGREIHASAPGVADLCGRTDLGEAIDLLSFASRVVTNDSGLMHVAAALDRPMVAIFGSSSPDYTPPLSRRATVARLALPCSPCFERQCPLGHTRCLHDITPADIMERALALPSA